MTAESVSRRGARAVCSRSLRSRIDLDMPSELEAVEAALLIAADEMIKAGAMAPATTGPIWNDSDKKAMLELAQRRGPTWAAPEG